MAADPPVGEAFLGPIPALPEGPEGNRMLREAFFALIPVLRPTAFCDIGANDGSTAVAARKLAPACAVYGFEANPRIHAMHAKTMASLGVEWLNLAITDTCGRLPVFAPRTLSRAYLNGEVVPAATVETEDTGKTSLLLRNEEATYETFEVEARSLDDVFRDRPAGRSERRFFLWIDVEGAADRVLAGAAAVLRETRAIFIETENFDFWRDQKRSGEVVAFLFERGFVPIARDREYGDKQFNILFVSEDSMSLLPADPIDPTSPLHVCFPQRREVAESPAHEVADGAPSRAFASVRSWLQADVPVLVPCFNNPSYARAMLRQLRALGLQRLVLIDNASTSPEMRAWLANLDGEATLIALRENLGPHHFLKDPGVLALLPRQFCVTDPDLAFNLALPEGFLGELAALTARYRVGKAGFALDISDRHKMRDRTFRINDKDWRIWEWEEQFWEKPIGELHGGDRVYDAPIDTTFALYDQDYFDPADFTRAVRVAGRFTARHLPWYRDHGLPEAEATQYARTQRFSYYYVNDQR